jgi:uncharacterized LabA/DUF88 family protein
MPPARTIVYVDGFNLYYGRLKGTTDKWLDLGALCANLLPNNDIQTIKYFTARVRPRSDNPDVHLQRQVYLAALKTIPNLSIHEGHFLESAVRMRLANPPAGGPNTVVVLKTEEKGSDVALASHLIGDGYEGLYDVAIVVSNDSDLVPPIEIVRNRLGRVVGVLNPHRNPSAALQRAASFYRPLRAGVVAASQFPDTITASDGAQLSKPLRWR